jgi:hypothetical protein
MNFEYLFRYIPSFTPETGVHLSACVYILGNKILPEHHHFSHNGDVCLANKITLEVTSIQLILAPDKAVDSHFYLRLCKIGTYTVKLIINRVKY